MGIQVILNVALMLLSTQAENCLEEQHCSNCSSRTGYCITDCFPGYFDLKCKSQCSKNCKNSECNQTDKGVPKCSEGCVPGFHGTQCNHACTSPRESCTICPQVCDGTFCHLTSSCVSGCHDSYYGSNCKTCSGRCRHCNRITGRCDVCHDPYSGRECQFSCEHCSATDCVQACAPGLYGRTCSKRCIKGCFADPPADTKNTVTSNSSNTCTSGCHRYSGECIHGRVDDTSDNRDVIIGTSNALVLFVFGIIVTVCMFHRKRVSANRDNQGVEFIHTERSGQVESLEYNELHQYWDIEDYDEVSQPLDQQQGPAEEDTISHPTVPVVADDFPGALETEDISDPALPVLADYLTGTLDTEDIISDPTVPVLADAFPGALDTEDNISDPALPVLADYLTGTLDTEDNISDPALPVWADYLTGTLDTEDNISDPALPVLADYLTGTLDTRDNISDPALPVLADYCPGKLDAEDNNSDSALPVLDTNLTWTLDTEDNGLDTGDTSSSSPRGSESYTHLMRDVIVDDENYCHILKDNP